MFRIVIRFHLPCGFPCLFPLFDFVLLSDNTEGEKEISAGSPNIHHTLKIFRVNEGKIAFLKNAVFSTHVTQKTWEPSEVKAS